ncbi:MAG: TonB-dependent receptor [Chlorobi bacterium]|nr:TonB-dependent receptor [Chlorobiota bacterium]
MTKSKLLLLIIAISAISLFGQNTDYKQTIRGTVIDKLTQTTLPGATIIVLNSDPVLGTTSDMNGEFKIENIPLGRQSIQVSFIGYHTRTINNLNLTSGKETVITIELEEQVQKLDEVVITAKQTKDRAINEMATVSARSFTVEETERFAGSLGDPSRMAANYAGVSMTNDSRNDIIIRGNSPMGLLWRLDGVEIPNPNHFGAAGTTGGPVSMLNNNLLSNSDFFTSAFPAQFGNAMSGVFDLNMRTGNNQKREYVGQIGFNGFEFGAEGPFKKGGKGSYIANYRYSTLGLMNAMGLDFGTGTAIPQYQDLTFKIDLPGTKWGRFSLMGLGGTSYIELHDSDKAEAASNTDSNYDYGGVDLDYGSDMGVLSLSHLYFLSKNTRVQSFLSIQGTRATTKIDSLLFDENGTLLPNSNYRFYDAVTTEIKYSASTHLKTRFNAKNNAIFGIYYDLYNVDLIDSVRNHDIGGFQKNFDINGNIYLIRGYGQWQHRFNDKLLMNIGLYSQYVNVNDEFVAEPRFGIKYNLDGGQSLSFGYGSHSEMMPRFYYFMQTRLDDGTYIMTNKNTALLKSHQWVIGYDKLFSENTRFKTEVYYQSLYDIPVTESLPEFSIINTGDDFGGLFPDSLINTGTGTNYGLEFTMEKFLGKGYYFLATVSLFESKYKGYSKTERNTAFNGNYVFNILGGYEFKTGKHSLITVDTRTVYAGGKRYVPIDIEKSIQENSTEYEWSKAYENKFDDYFRIDLRIGFKINGKKINQEWALDLQNITNSKNIYRQSYNPRTHNISYDYQTGFFPMFLYRIQF